MTARPSPGWPGSAGAAWYRAAFAALLLLVMGAAPATAGSSATRDLDDLVKWMTGSFGSGLQAEQDTLFLDIRLHVTPIWRDLPGARWLYVEQATAEQQDRPYRQRVYRLTMLQDGSIESAVFTLPAPLRFAGRWREREPLAALTPDSLVHREGCSVYLRRVEKDGFRGGTLGTDCPSDLRGASYATSEVAIERNRMISLDRGFDANGQQVWGSTRGGYEFVRVRGR